LRDETGGHGAKDGFMKGVAAGRILFNTLALQIAVRNSRASSMKQTRIKPETNPNQAEKTKEI
jgi:hypothetical protein